MYGKQDPWVRPLWGHQVKRQVPPASYYQISPIAEFVGVYEGIKQARRKDFKMFEIQIDSEAVLMVLKACRMAVLLVGVLFKQFIKWQRGIGR
ncbi:hypothetical protein JHK82_024968 [Glycine max]|nr:hypothetical protein JHK82_024968 [Glycine max]